MAWQWQLRDLGWPQTTNLMGEIRRSRRSFGHFIKKEEVVVLVIAGMTKGEGFRHEAAS